MPEIKIGDKVTLRDKAAVLLGELSIQESRHGAWCGIFAPASGYASIRDLFVEWTELVNDQCFSLLDEVDDKISAVAISAYHDDKSLPLREIQLYHESHQILGSITLLA